MLEALDHGRKAFRRRAWNDACRWLSRADQHSPLDSDDLERLATSAYLIGRDDDHQRYLQRAHHAHLHADNAARAARCAFWLGLTLLFRGEDGQAHGWFARAQRLVQGRDCVERGYLLVPVAEQQLAGGCGDSAYATATEAVELGERFADADLVACARHLQGRARIQGGYLPEGLRLLDEAMLSAVAGELSPIMTGLIYCSLIAVCQDVYAFARASEWTAALAKWCKQQPQMVAFTSTCLVHRAQVLAYSGAWSEAIAEVRRACERCVGRVPAEALYQRAELHRLRGEFEAAEAGYREAGQRGWEPQPGLALLRMAQGRVDAASAAIRRVLGTTAQPLKRAALLCADVEIALAAGDGQRALQGCRELEGIATRFDTDVLQAMAAQARGAVELAAGEAEAALVSLRGAFDRWRRVNVPYQLARVRVLIGTACRALGDDEASELEFAAARRGFEGLGAAADIAGLATSGRRQVSAPAATLTPREREVLRRVASGETNKRIALALRLSERTVDRHVSNILTKLGVPSRAAATAVAYRHHLL